MDGCMESSHNFLITDHLFRHTSQPRTFLSWTNFDMGKRGEHTPYAFRVDGFHGLTSPEIS